MPLACTLATRLPGAWRTTPYRSHVAVCLRCQANGARGRRLRRDLRQLGMTVEPAPVGLTGAVMSSLDLAPVSVIHRSHAGRRIAAGGALLATAVGAVVVAARRSRPAHG